MLTNRIARVHHNKVPPVGSIVEVHLRPLGPGCRYRKFRVVSYPGLAVGRYLSPFTNSHLVHVEALDNRARFTIACHWLKTVDE